MLATGLFPCWLSAQIACATLLRASLVCLRDSAADVSYFVFACAGVGKSCLLLRFSGRVIMITNHLGFGKSVHSVPIVLTIPCTTVL